MVGLTVEGGGMRGIISVAMIAAVDDVGLTHSFDAVYAASSGATNAASVAASCTANRLTPS
jgi:predicted acylesterase/phospholipase RssA